MNTPAVVLPRLRPALDDLPVYRAGQPAGAGDVGKLSANENPFAPLPSVLDAVARAATTLNRYPDPASTVITDALAERHGVAAEHVAVGAGSVALCQQLVQATAATGDEVLFAWRSFEAYPILTRLADATPRPVPLTTTGEHDLGAMLASVGPRTRLVLVCNPNNPTGRAIPARDLAAFVAAVPADVLVVVDEAYAEFVRDPDVTSAAPLLDDHPNVCVLRTFSKAYGLAGLRIGYALGHPAVAKALRRTTTTFAVTALAQQAAIASLAAEHELQERVEAVIEQRERLAAELRRHGWPVGSSEANFLWIEDDGRAPAFVRACEQNGLSVRSFPGEGVRVTIGTAEATELLGHTAARAATATSDAAAYS